MTSPQGIIQPPAVQSWTDIKIYDHDSLPVPDNSSLQPACMNAVRRRLQRKSLLPELFMDPLKPLPLADAAVPQPAVHIVYLIMASRPYAHETISRNVRALQRPGAANDLGCNDSNLFLIHVDAKMAADKARSVLDAVGARPDVYFLKRSRAVMWAGWSMMLVLMDVMASLLERSLGFDLLINLSDADLSLRVDGEIRAFFSRFPGRSVMSIVQRKRDPRRYQMHERFRQYCWIECDEGKAFVISKRDYSTRPEAMQVIGKRKCCWSRSAPMLYAALSFKCPNADLPEVFHGSQWVMLHRSMVEYMVRHPFAQRVVAAMENTLLPDEALLQTLAVNSPLRRTVIPSHLRFIEWPQMHGDANKYWASVGPQFHGGPMVLNASLARKAFGSPATFARKVDPGVYLEAFDAWDRWMAAKLITGSAATGQPAIAQNLLGHDPLLNRGLPPPTPYDEPDEMTRRVLSSALVYPEATGAESPRPTQPQSNGSALAPPLAATVPTQRSARVVTTSPTSGASGVLSLLKDSSPAAVLVMVWILGVFSAAVVFVLVICVKKAADDWGSSKARRAIGKQAMNATKLV